MESKRTFHPGNIVDLDQGHKVAHPSKVLWPLGPVFTEQDFFGSYTHSMFVNKYLFVFKYSIIVESAIER